VYIYPAIDIKDGKCVRLRQGDKDQKTIYDANPVKVALKWERMGAKILHIVDLDGAFYGKSNNIQIIHDIIDAISIPVQIGGGFRTLDKIDYFLENPKIKRVILGTSAIAKPKLLEEAIEKHKQRIAVGIDTKKGKVAIQGWVEETGVDFIDFAKQLEEKGVNTVIYTDISKDGMLSGPNFQAISRMVKETNLNVIASGGVSTTNDIEKLKEIGVKGVIIGKALYTGDILLAEALKYEEE